MPRRSDDELLRALEADGLLRREGDRWRTARRWQGAIMRAAASLHVRGEDGDDLRVPIAHAVLELYGPEVDDDDAVAFVRLLTAIQIQELAPLAPSSGHAP